MANERDQNTPKSFSTSPEASKSLNNLEMNSRYVQGLKPWKVEVLFSLVDIMPTVLELAGLEIPKTVHGKILLPLIRGEQDAFRYFVVTSTFLYAPGEPSSIVDEWLRTVEKPHFSTLTTPEWTFLYSTEESPAYRYNVKNDPKEESHNVIDRNWGVAEDSHQKFVKFLEELGMYAAIPRRRLSREHSEHPQEQNPHKLFLNPQLNELHLKKR